MKVKCKIRVDIIKDFMLENKISKTELSKRSGVSLKSLNSVFNGSIKISAVVIIKIAKYMEVRREDLFVKII